jgi:hypothetical protein
MNAITSYKRIDDIIKGIWSNRCNVCGRRVPAECMMTINECVRCFAESYDIDEDIIDEISAPDRRPSLASGDM